MVLSSSNLLYEGIVHRTFVTYRVWWPAAFYWLEIFFYTEWMWQSLTMFPSTVFNVSKVIKKGIICLFDMLGSFCVCKINYARNGCGNTSMRKYWYNNHHIEVNLESCNDLVCVVLSLGLGKPCSLLEYQWNKWWVTSQGGEGCTVWAWRSLPINVKGLILMTWWLMLDCRSTNKNILVLIHNDIIM